MSRQHIKTMSNLNKQNNNNKNQNLLNSLKQKNSKELTTSSQLNSIVHLLNKTFKLVKVKERCSYAITKANLFR